MRTLVGFGLSVLVGGLTLIGTLSTLVAIGIVSRLSKRRRCA